MATALGETKTMQISGLEFLFLEVNNLEESVAFYRDSLGFEVSKHSPESEPPLATVQAGNLKISLAQHLETMLKRGRGVSFFIGVSDVDDYYNQLRAKGVEVYPPADEGWGGRFITLEDPDKYRLFFVTWTDDRRAFGGGTATAFAGG
jgi:predicted enzyme related to lactoylglutathione lyase